MTVSNYNLAALKNISGFNLNDAVMSFSGEEPFFRKLSEFADVSGKYLSTYNPVVVVHSDEARDHFLEELNEVKTVLSTLRITAADAEIMYMEKAVANNSEHELSDGIINFLAKIKILTKAVHEAQL